MRVEEAAGAEDSGKTRSELLDERMSSDVITGHDGKPRCAWAGAGDTAGGRYPRRGLGYPHP